MSGGSYDYAYYRIEELAREIRPTTPLRKAFKTLLVKVAKAAHDIEWVDSGDYGPGDEDESILDCLGTNAKALVLTEAIQEAEAVLQTLTKAIEEAKA
jgi:hypothetical protein